MPCTTSRANSSSSVPACSWYCSDATAGLITTSPSSTGTPGSGSSSSGNDNTSVGPDDPMCSALSSAMSSIPMNVTVSSPSTRWSVSTATARRCQRSRSIDTCGESSGSRSSATTTVAAWPTVMATTQRRVSRPRSPRGCHSVLVPASSCSYAATMSATIRWRTTSAPVSRQNAEPIDTGQHLLQPCKAALAHGDVDLCRVTGDDHPGPEADTREEHLHLLRCRVLRLVENDEAVVERSPAHERQRGHLDHLPLEEALHRIGVEHVVQRVVQRAEVRVDLRHQVTWKEAQPLPRLDRWPSEDDPLHLLGLQRLDGHRHRKPRLSGPCGSQTEGDHVLGDRVDVALLPGGLRLDLTALGPAQDLMCEDLARPFARTDHRHHSPEGDVIELLAGLQQRGELLEQARHRRDLGALLTRDPHLVAADADANRREALFDLAQVVIARSDEGGHHMGAGDDNGR